MASRRFIPSVEQLERRLMLSVAPAMMPGLDAVQSTSATIAASMYEQDVAATHFDVAVTSEHDGADHVLLVKIGNLDSPRLVGIVGGDSAWTQPDGTVRLRQPAGVRELELTIVDNGGQAVPLVRLEFDNTGYIVHQEAAAISTDHSQFKGISLAGLYDPAESHNDHASTLGTMESISTSQADMAGDSSHSLDPQSVDDVLTQHYGMPAMSTAMSYAPFTIVGHSMLVPDAPTTSSDVTMDEMQMEHVGEGISIAALPSMEVAEMSMEDEMLALAGNATFEIAAVGWQEGEDAETVETIPGDTEEQVPQPEPGEMILAAMPVEPMTVFANYSLRDLQSSAPAEDSASGSWPILGGVLLAIATASGACVLEYRAQQYRAQQYRAQQYRAQRSSQARDGYSLPDIFRLRRVVGAR